MNGELHLDDVMTQHTSLFVRLRTRSTGRIWQTRFDDVHTNFDTTSTIWLGTASISASDAIFHQEPREPQGQQPPDHKEASHTSHAAETEIETGVRMSI